MTKKNPLKFALKNQARRRGKKTNNTYLQSLNFTEMADLSRVRTLEATVAAIEARLVDKQEKLEARVESAIDIATRVEGYSRKLGHEMTYAQSDIIKLKGQQAADAAVDGPTKINTELAREIHELKRKLEYANGRIAASDASSENFRKQLVELQLRNHEIQKCKDALPGEDWRATAERLVRERDAAHQAISNMSQERDEERVAFWRRTAEARMQSVLRLRNEVAYLKGLVGPK